MSDPYRLRVMMTADAVGGAWVVTTALARELARRGHEVALLTLGPAPSAAQREAVAVPGLSLVPTDLALEWMDPDGTDFSHAREKLAAYAEAFGPDVIHLGGFREALTPFEAPVLIVAHSCVRSWWRACRGGEPDEPRWHTYADNVARGLAAAEMWVAPTAAFCDEITRLYAPPRPGLVIHNGVPSAVVIEEDRKAFVLAAGRLWDEGKNIRALVDVAPDLPWPVRLAGPAKAPHGVALEAPEARRVELIGDLARADLLAEMHAAEIFASPAHYEPFGLTVAEAAACGAALVLSDIPSFRELWDGAAVFVHPDDRAALQLAVTRLCNDPALRQRLQEAARERAARYTVAAMADAYEDLYQGLAGNPAGARASRPSEEAETSRAQAGLWA
ncbi:glycosyltransferase family 4 protein [Rhodovulum sp. PH10]|uniref:glycosyltransferase family 4 protein n=1 Tax=Rhodovulum sp. PH10 TaxID=1187851 RepID=UPI00068FCE46|nr:glycosyltransferase family 4 protein [Rhodovulum sp. PH10]